MLKYLSILKY